MTDDSPPPLPVIRWEPLLQGPLILAAVSRIMTIPLYLACAIGASHQLRNYLQHFFYYRAAYVAVQAAVTVAMWDLLLLNVLLAFLFFSRHRMFRLLMIYFSLLPWLFFVGMIMNSEYFKPRHRTPSHDEPYMVWIGGSILTMMVVWPFYYSFSPRVKRIFTR